MHEGRALQPTGDEGRHRSSPKPILGYGCTLQNLKVPDSFGAVPDLEITNLRCDIHILSDYIYFSKKIPRNRFPSKVCEEGETVDVVLGRELLADYLAARGI